MALLRAKTSFFVARRFVARGAVVDSTDRIVKGREDLFAPVEPTFRSVVEQATAAPGEARTVTSKVAKAVRKSTAKD